MKRATLIYVVLTITLSIPLQADMLTACWGNGANVQHAKAVKLDGDKLSFDLSALPKDAKVYAARLFMSPVRWADPSFDLACAEGPLKLVEPYFMWYDASAAAAAWVKAGGGSLQVRKGPKVDPDAVTLEIAYEGKADGEPPKPVTDVKALYRAGQVFITFKEIEPADGGKADVTWSDVAGKFVGDFYGPLPNPKAAKQITYRVYTHDQPITAANIGQAHLVAEVLPGSAFNTRASVQADPSGKAPPRMVGAHAGKTGENVTIGPSILVQRVGVEPGKAVEPGTGICVHTVTAEGKAYYAVLAGVNGVVNAKDISDANAVGPVDQKVAAPEPVLYREFATAGKFDRIEQWYSYWTVQPLSPWPARYDVVVSFCATLLEKSPALYFDRGGWGTGPAYGRADRTNRLVISHTADDPVDMGVGQVESMHSQKGFTDSKFITGFPNRQAALVQWAKAKWQVDPNRITAHMGDWGMQELRRGDTYGLIMGWGLPEYAKGWQTFQRARGQWGTPDMFRGRPEDQNPYALSNLTDFVLANPKHELPFLIMYARGGSHFSEMGWPPVPRFLAAMEKTKRAFIYGGRASPAEDAIRSGAISVNLGKSVPALAHCTFNDNPGEGELRSGENYVAQINGFVLWDSAGIVDEPDRYQVTLWAAPSCFYADGWTDMTPRRCQKFKAAPGAKFAWTNTLIEEPPAAGEPAAVAPRPGKAKPPATAASKPAAAAKPAVSKLIQSGTAIADENGLVTLEKIGLTKGKHRIEIKPQ